MNNVLTMNMKSWITYYNPCTDILQFYDIKAADKAFSKYMSKKVTKSKHWNVYYKDDLPVFIEIKNTYNQIGDVERMNKDDIIKAISKRIKNYTTLEDERFNA